MTTLFRVDLFQDDPIEGSDGLVIELIVWADSREAAERVVETSYPVRKYARRRFEQQLSSGFVKTRSWRTD